MGSIDELIAGLPELPGLTWIVSRGPYVRAKRGSSVSGTYAIL